MCVRACVCVWRGVCVPDRRRRLPPQLVCVGRPHRDGTLCPNSLCPGSETQNTIIAQARAVPINLHQAKAHRSISLLSPSYG